MLVIIDRFEGEYAVLETGNGVMKKIKRQELPGTAREGDVLVYRDNKWIIDMEAAAERKQQIDALAAELWENK